jgi:hypothetical protein
MCGFFLNWVWAWSRFTCSRISFMPIRLSELYHRPALWDPKTDPLQIIRTLHGTRNIAAILSEKA